MIRKAKLDDFEGILKVFREVQNLHAENEPTIFKFSDPIDFNSFKEILENKDIFFLVSEDNKIINGFITCLIVEKGSNLTLPRKILAIETLAVKKEFHKRKVGKKLMDTAIKLANHEKCDSLNLNVWCFNENAIGFYKHLGFKEKSINMQLDI